MKCRKLAANNRASLAAFNRSICDRKFLRDAFVDARFYDLRNLRRRPIFIFVVINRLQKMNLRNDFFENFFVVQDLVSVDERDGNNRNFFARCKLKCSWFEFRGGIFVVRVAAFGKNYVTLASLYFILHRVQNIYRVAAASSPHPLCVYQGAGFWQKQRPFQIVAQNKRTNVVILADDSKRVIFSLMIREHYIRRIFRQIFLSRRNRFCERRALHNFDAMPQKFVPVFFRIFFRMVGVPTHFRNIKNQTKEIYANDIKKFSHKTIIFRKKIFVNRQKKFCMTKLAFCMTRLTFWRRFLKHVFSDFQ